MINKKFDQDGLLLVNKPTGMTSHDVVSKIRRCLKTKEVGHTGTLDPLASGLMVVLLNEATKLSSFFLEGDKGYQVTFVLGYQSDTLDITADQVLKTNSSLLMSTDILQLENLLKEKAQLLKGEFQWPVPIYSAAKVDGKKLYEYARSGEAVEVPIKEMKFWDIEYVGFEEKSINQEVTNAFKFNLKCSKGSFIRSWVYQLGLLLETGALMVELERTFSKPFSIHQSLTLEELEIASIDKISSQLIPLNRALAGIPVIRVEGSSLKLLQNGQISFDLKNQLVQSCQDTNSEQFFQIHSGFGGQLVAVCEYKPREGFRLRRVFKS